MKVTLNYLLILAIVLLAVYVEDSTAGFWGRRTTVTETSTADTYTVTTTYSRSPADCKNIYVPRSDSVAVKAKKQPRVAGGYTNVYIHREEPNKLCEDRTTCTNLIEPYRDEYNFFLGQDSTIYEGLGWDYTGKTGGAIDIAVIGSYTDPSDRPNDDGIAALRRLIDCGSKQGKLSMYVKTNTVTDSPLGDIIKTWKRTVIKKIKKSKKN